MAKGEYKDDRVKRYQKRTKPAVAQWRIDFIKLLVLITAFALIVYDAFVSYQGFRRLDVGDHAPAIFCVLIFVTQLGVGVLHALGEEFTNVMADSGHGWGNTIWKIVLVILYSTDIMSNAIEFGFFDRWDSPLLNPVETFGGALLIMAMAWGLTFADETLLRLYDRVEQASAKNNIFARRYRQTVAQHKRYLAVVHEYQMEQAANKAQYEGAQWKFGDNL